MSPPLSNLAENKGDTRRRRRRRRRRRTMGEVERPRESVSNPREREPKLLVPPPIAHPRDLLPVFMNFLDVCLEL